MRRSSSFLGHVGDRFGIKAEMGSNISDTTEVGAWKVLLFAREVVPAEGVIGEGEVLTDRRRG